MWTMFMLVLSLNFPSAMNPSRVTSVYHQTVSWLQLAVPSSNTLDCEHARQSVEL